MYTRPPSWRSVINKYLFGDDGDMTKFNRAMEEAKEWKKLNNKTTELRKTGEVLSEKDLRRFEELNKNHIQYRRVLAAEQSANKMTRTHLEHPEKFTEKDLRNAVEQVVGMYREALRGLEAP